MVRFTARLVYARENRPLYPSDKREVGPIVGMGIVECRKYVSNPNPYPSRSRLWTEPTRLTMDFRKLCNHSEVQEHDADNRGPRGLRSEMSSTDRKQNSWVRTPFKAWIYVYYFSVLSCVDNGHETGWPLPPVILILAGNRAESPRRSK
jgi:hypothetical protein